MSNGTRVFAILVVVAATCTPVRGAYALDLADLFGSTKVPFSIPAKYPGAAALRSLALVPADTRTVPLTTALEASLVGVRVDDRPFYSRIAMAPVLGGGGTDALVIGAGQREGTAGAMAVRLVQMDAVQAMSQEPRSRCTAQSNKLFAKCPKNAIQSYVVNCVQRTARVAVSVRVFDVDKRRLVASDIVPGSYAVKACHGEEPAMPPDSDLYGRAVDVVLKGIAGSVAPTVEERKLELLDADARITGDAKQTFAGAMKFARAKRMDEACSRFEKLYESNKDSVALSYNVGFCAESRGELFNAATAYKQASTLANAPHRLVDAHYMAVDKLLKSGSSASSPDALRTDVPAIASGVRPTAAQLKSQRRVALVIGNSKYVAHALKNPGRDAQLVAKELAGAGFDVTEVHDLSSGRMAHVIDEFVERARNADAALLYYSGHAFQVNGENWMMPTDDDKVQCLEDAVADASGAGEPWAVQLNDVLARLDATTSGARIVVFDACRDSRFPACKRSASRGLARMSQVPQGSLVAFSTSPGMTVPDGRGDNSVYAKHFAQAIRVPNITIEEALKRVRAAVARESTAEGQKQMPVEVGGLTGDFYFRVAD